MFPLIWGTLLRNCFTFFRQVVAACSTSSHLYFNVLFIHIPLVPLMISIPTWILIKTRSVLKSSINRSILLFIQSSLCLHQLCLFCVCGADQYSEPPCQMRELTADMRSFTRLFSCLTQLERCVKPSHRWKRRGGADRGGQGIKGWGCVGDGALKWSEGSSCDLFFMLWALNLTSLFVSKKNTSGLILSASVALYLWNSLHKRSGAVKKKLQKMNRPFTVELVLFKFHFLLSVCLHCYPDGDERFGSATWKPQALTPKHENTF